MNQTSFCNWLQEEVLCFSTTSCSVIASTPQPRNSFSTSNNKSNNKSEGLEIIQHSPFGLVITKFYKVSMTGDGEDKTIEMTIISFFKCSYPKSSSIKVLIFPTSLPLLFLESEIMALTEEEMYTIGQFGQLVVLSKATKVQSVNSTVSSEPKLFLFGKL